jgi:DNA-binding NarL/FixJ family response regulator
MGETFEQRPAFDRGAAPSAGGGPIHIAVVDDHELFLSGITGLIRQMDSRFVVSGYLRGSNFIESLKTTSRPDILITDLTMKQVNGLALAAVVRQQLPQLPIIMVSGVEDALVGENLPKLGISSFVAKSASEATLKQAIMAALHEQESRSSRPLTHRAPPPADLPELAPRQVQIISLVASGAPNRQISETLRISENTVKSHLKDIFSELGVSSRTAAVRRARELGFL